MNKTIRIKNAILSLIIIALFLGFIPVISFAGSWNGWIYQDPYPTSNHLYAVKFVTPKKGWVAGEQGTILYTEDGGDTWEYQESGTEKQIRSLFFINERKGWAVGGEGDSPVREKGIILHTDDGGKTWVEQQGEFDSAINSVFFLNDKEGWIAGKEGVLLHTPDGGKKWERQKSVGVTRAIASIYFVNSQTGWLLAGDEIYRTADGGKKWDAASVGIIPPTPRMVPGMGISPIPANFPPNWSLGSVYFANEKRGWAVVGREFIFMTADGGKTWTDQLKTGSMSYGLGSISFIDDKRGCVVGTTILCTEDGGATWKERLGIYLGGRDRIDGFPISLMGITLVNQSAGWAVGIEGQIMKTEDNGKTWKMSAKRDECGGKPFFINKKTGWLHNALWSHSTHICRTVDGGLTWEKQEVGIEVSDVFFIDSFRGWAVGSLKEAAPGQKPGALIVLGKVWNIIKFTNDGGKTWRTQFKNVIADNLFYPGLEGVFFLNRNTGWAVGIKGTILHTTDGGATWKLQNSRNTKIILTTVQFIDPNEGWIIGATVEDGEAGYVLHTTDGGKHWQTQYKYKKDSGLDGIFFMDDKSGWVTGATEQGYGWLLHTTDAGKTWSEKKFPGIGDSYPRFIDKNKGLLSTDKGWLVITTDGGATWTKVRKPLPKQPWHFSEVFKKVKVNK